MGSDVCSGDHATSDDVARLQSTLDQVLVQARQTNGRLSKVEGEVSTMQRVLKGEPDIAEDRGLIAEHKEIRAIVLDSRAVIRAVKWAGPLLALGTPIMAAVGASLGA